MFRIFTYQDLGELRVHIYEDSFWFVAADLVNLLGHEDTQFLTAEYVSFADKGMTAEAPNHYILTVNECGAYSLICGIRNSRSGKLLHWLVNEVIPELRKPIEPIAPAVDVSEITAAPSRPIWPQTIPSVSSACGKHSPSWWRAGAPPVKMQAGLVVAYLSASSLIVSAGTPQISDAHSGVFGPSSAHLPSPMT